MVHSVVAPRMTSAFDIFEEFGMPADIVAYEEKCGFDAVMVEEVEDPGCDFGYGAVVERQVDDATVLMTFESPYRLREKEAV